MALGPLRRLRRDWPTPGPSLSLRPMLTSQTPARDYCGPLAHALRARPRLGDLQAFQHVASVFPSLNQADRVLAVRGNKVVPFLAHRAPSLGCALLGRGAPLEGGSVRPGWHCATATPCQGRWGRGRCDARTGQARGVRPTWECLREDSKRRWHSSRAWEDTWALSAGEAWGVASQA